MTAPLTDAQIQSLREAAQKVPDVGTPEFEWYSFGQLKRLGFRAADGEFLELASPATVLALLDEREKARINFAEAVREGLRAVAEVKAERDALRAERDALAIANVALTATALYKRAEAAEADAARLSKALEPFSKYAGIVFERNFNNSDPVDSMTASDGGQVTIYAEDFFRARAALTTKGTAE